MIPIMVKMNNVATLSTMMARVLKVEDVLENIQRI